MTNTIILIVTGIVIGLVVGVGVFAVVLQYSERTRRAESAKNTAEREKNQMASYYQAQNKGRTEEERQIISTLVSGQAILQSRMEVSERDHGQLVNELYARIDGLKSDLLGANEKLEKALELIGELNKQIAALTAALAKSEAE